MARVVATTKQTGGGGYSFEDKVAARMMALMLSGLPPLDESSGPIRRIDFQGAADGWRLDDLVLFLGGMSGESYFALSVKSDQQVTGSGFPSEFVTAVWEQWLGKGPAIFDSARDYLGLAVGALPTVVRNAWNGLFPQIRDADSARFLLRLSTPRATNDTQRKLFKSLACNIPGEAGSEAETVALARRIRLLTFDFESVPSIDEQSTVSICRDVLESQSRSDAGDLWEKLLGIARELGPTGGSLELKHLIDRLRRKFRLKDYPDYASDVRQVNAARDRLLSDVVDRIGAKVTLDRSVESEEISSLLDNHRGAVLLGPSGSGKSVLTKKLAEAATVAGPVAWFDAQALDEPNLARVEQWLQLRHNLVDVFTYVTSSQALLVFDGIDRFSENARRHAATLMKATGFENESSPWKVILTCQPEEWDIAEAALLRLGASLQAVVRIPVDFPAIEQLKPVWEEFRNLRPLAYRRELSPVLRNVHLLNVLASHAALIGGHSSKEWVGESHLIRWFWRDVIEAGHNGYARSHLLQRVGRHEAEGLSPRLIFDELSSTEASIIGELERLCICRVRDGRVSLTHDLFGDWARFRILLAQSECLDVFLTERIAIPRWFRSVRLLGLDLLEQQNGDVTAWRNAMERLRQATGKYDLRTDLLLESVVFAANPAPLLEAVYPDLVREDGALLRRLLNRFMFVATLPNSVMRLLAEKGSDFSSSAATIDRDPDWPHWPALISFLALHAADMATLAPEEVAVVANTWLRKSKRSWPGRSEAASLAITIAERHLASRQRPYRHGEADRCKAILSALVAACAERPDEATPILRSLCKRANAAQKRPGQVSDVVSTKRLTLRAPGQSREPSLPPPWPDGPFERVDGTIRSVLLDSQTLTPLFSDHAVLAREVILALTVKHPVPIGVQRHYPRFSREYGTESPHEWRTHLWLRGPFLGFLVQSPHEGLDTILRLVNHATERWSVATERYVGQNATVTIEHEGESRDLRGDNDVYFWYLDNQNDAHCVVCALMALEKWFYLQLDEGKSVSEWIELIWRNARSVAFCGLLNAVGRRAPELFKGPLQPLLGTWEFHVWEFHEHRMGMRDSNFRSGFLPGSWTSSGEWLFTTARDWYQLPHRRTSFEEVALNILFNDASLRPYFAESQRRWGDKLASLRQRHTNADRRDLERLVKLFKIENWIERNEDGKIWLECPDSEAEGKARGDALTQSRLRQRFSEYPSECRQILDGTKELVTDELERFWSELSQLSGYLDREDERRSLTSVDDVVTGGIAVLMVLHPEWLDEHPSRKEWCEEQLRAIRATPPPPGPLWSESAPFEHYSDSFCADIAAAEWTRRPKDAAARWFVADMATSFRYATVGVLMRRVTHHRQRIGEEYDRLQSLIVFCAALRDVWSCARSIQYRWDRGSNWVGRAINAFVEKKIPVHLKSWERIERGANRRSARMRFRVSLKAKAEGEQENPFLGELLEYEMKNEGLDLNLIKVAFRDLPTVSEAESEEDRERVVSAHRNLLGIAMRRASVECPDDYQLYSDCSDPSDYGHWILRRVAVLVAQLGPGEQSSAFWKPILDLRPEARDWTKSYLQSWFSSGVKFAPSVESFSSTWQVQIAHALASPRWDAKINPVGDELLTELLGLGWFSLDVVGAAEFRSTITSMSTLYRKWASRCLMDIGAVATFSRFLRRPAAAELLTDGMIWILEAARDFDEADWDGTSREKGHLVDLLEHWWQVRGERGPSTDAGRAPALGLLRILADQQHPRALEILDRVARSR
jgi:hypothetical protein